MADDDKTLDFLEQQIPAMARSAVTQAYWRTLAAGLSVLVTEGDAIYEVFPDGTRRLVKKIEPPVPVPPNAVYTIK